MDPITNERLREFAGGYLGMGWEEVAAMAHELLALRARLAAQGEPDLWVCVLPHGEDDYLSDFVSELHGEALDYAAAHNADAEKVAEVGRMTILPAWYSPPAPPVAPAREDLMELAWGIIANAGGGDWTKERPEWRAAAERWRDQYHATLGLAPSVAPAPRDPNRCAVCGWPLDPTGASCRRGNCARRPRPATLYDPERAAREADGPGHEGGQ